MNKLMKGLSLALLLAIAPLSAAQAQIEGTITEASARKFRVAIPDFNTSSPEARGFADQVSAIVRNDLRSTGLFDLVDPSAFVETGLTVQLQPRFADWRLIKTEALLVADVSDLPNGEIVVGFRLWDTGKEEEHLFPDANGNLTVKGRQFRVTPDYVRRVAHVIADNIYTSLTGDEGYFDTRIVFISESGSKINRVKRLAIMDQDGANAEFLTSGRYTVLTPRFSPTDQKITYMTYEQGRPQVYLFDIETGRSESLGRFQGMTYAPRFSTDGKSVLMSQAVNGNSDVYMMDLSSQKLTRLTEHPAIDTSPSMSPDGKYITFTSDRGGSPQIYVMRSNGAAMTCPQTGQLDTACRITGFSGGGRYSTPVWSPRGDYIAFTKQSGGQFYIGVIQPDGRGERLLSQAYLDEGPAWSPNGRVIIFFRETRPGADPALYSVDLTGRNLRKVNTPGAASDPAWSPPLK